MKCGTLAVTSKKLTDHFACLLLVFSGRTRTAGNRLDDAVYNRTEPQRTSVTTSELTTLYMYRVDKQGTVAARVPERDEDLWWSYNLDVRKLEFQRGFD
jgi:hypothetical protein